MKIVKYTAQGYQSLFHYECMRKRFVAFIGGIQSGKCLAADQGVMLADGGIKSAGMLRPGDSILGYDPLTDVASPAKITHTEIATKKCYEIVLHGAGNIKCSQDHRFYVWNAKRKKHEIRRASQCVSLRNKPGSNFIYFLIPKTTTFCADVKHIISPHFLGMILGDGCISGRHGSLYMSMANDFICENVEAESKKFGMLVKWSSKYDYRIVVPGGKGHGRGGGGIGSPIVSELRRLGLMGCDSYTKFIPDVYLNGSIEDRAELLAGLIDTDGYVCDTQSIEYCTMSAALCHGVVFLVRSLGGRATVQRGHVGQYRVRICLNRPLPTRVNYKKFDGSIEYNKRRCGVKSWKDIGEQNCVHISVSNPSQLFLLENFVITHNTISAAHQAWFEVIRNAEPKRGWIIGPTYQMSEVAEREFRNICPEAIRKSSVQRGRSVYEICNGHIVEVKTSEEPDRLRGDRIGWCWMDEAAMMTRETFDIILGRVLRYQGKIFCSTTPRGKNWIYDEFYRKSQPTDPMYDEDYGCIRATSLDNKYLSAKEVARLKSKYSTRYGQQELDAEFVSFEGLVYREFDIGRHVVKPADPGDRTYRRVLAGIDFGINDPFVCLWMAFKDGRWHVVDEYYQAGKTVDHHAPRLLANPWQPRVEACYADYHDVEARMSLMRHGVNSVPSRDHEIQIGVNELGRMLVQQLPDGGPRLVVCSNCKNTIREFQTYKYPEQKLASSRDAGDTPRQVGEKPIDKDNHCLIPGTLVRTASGDRPIELVRIGEKVLTRDGLKEVVSNGITQQIASVYRLDLSDGRYVIGTGNHPVWVVGDGFRRLDKLRYGDILSCISIKEMQKCRFAQRSQSLSNIAELHLEGIRALKGETTGFISSLTRETIIPDLIICIGRFGRILEEIFQGVLSYIIKTGIRLTTGLKILNAWMGISMPVCMAMADPWNGEKGTGSIYRKSAIWPPSGIEVRRGDYGMPDIARRYIKKGNIGKYHAQFAGMFLRQKIQKKPPVFAEIIAKPGIAGIRGLMTWLLSVLGVRSLLKRTYIPGQGHAAVSVVGLQGVGKSPVYDLTVRDKHEFYANGILVSNCLDSVRYVVMGDIGSYEYLGPTAAVEKKPGPGTYGWLKEQWLRTARESGEWGTGMFRDGLMDLPSWSAGGLR